MDRKTLAAIREYNREWQFFVFKTMANLHLAFTHKLEKKPNQELTLPGVAHEFNPSGDRNEADTEFASLESKMELKLKKAERILESNEMTPVRRCVMSVSVKAPAGNVEVMKNLSKAFVDGLSLCIFVFTLPTVETIGFCGVMVAPRDDPGGGGGVL